MHVLHMCVGGYLRLAGVMNEGLVALMGNVLLVPGLLNCSVSELSDEVSCRTTTSWSHFSSLCPDVMKMTDLQNKGNVVLIKEPIKRC